MRRLICMRRRFYYKTPVLWNHKFDRFCDIKKWISWYQKSDLVIPQNRNCDVKKSLRVFYIISQNRFCDITKSILWYHKIDFFYITKSFRFFYIKKYDFVISKNGISDIKIRFCDITKSNLYFDIKKSNMWYQKWFCDITKSLWFCDIKKFILWYHKIIFYISVLWKNDSSRK